MAQEEPEFTYLNLAVRGKLLKQVIDDQLPVAISYVTGPDTLFSFHAGANDALGCLGRPGFVARGTQTQRVPFQRESWTRRRAIDQCAVAKYLDGRFWPSVGVAIS